MQRSSLVTRLRDRSRAGPLPRRAELARLLVRARLAGPVERARRLTAGPTYSELCRDSAGLVVDAGAALEILVGTAGSELAEEFDSVAADVARALASIKPAFPDVYKVGSGTAALLYRLVRTQKPDQVLEIGVADGVSTAVILAALDANGHGALTSVDIRSDAGGVVGSHDRWTLEVIPRDGSDQVLGGIARRVGPVDICFHDARHDYEGQVLDYLAVWPALRAGSLLVSDDVDWSRAFVDFALNVGACPVYLADGPKLTGALVANVQFDT